MAMIPEAALYLETKCLLGSEVLQIPAQVSPSAPSAVDSPSRPLRVLVVEDEQDTANSTQVLLELLGFEVGVAYTGRAAVHVARHFQPDVVLCDLALPGMDGYAVAAALRQEPKLGAVRLIAISGYPPESLACRRPAAFERHLLKPVDPEELVGAVQTCRRYSSN